MIHRPAFPTQRSTLGALASLALAAMMALSPASLATADATTDDTAKKAAVAVDFSGADGGVIITHVWYNSAYVSPGQVMVLDSEYAGPATNTGNALGKLVSRQLASSLLQTSNGTAGMPKGTFVIAQFTSSFENLKSALETVAFKQESDGAWRAAGYFIKPD